MARLAVYTFGILHEAWEHPRTQGFVERVPTVFGAAENSSGDRDRIDRILKEAPEQRS